MLESLLKTEDIPTDLRRFVQDRTEGNPFYLEEVVNSLIESGTLTRDNGSWKVTKSITESDISSTIHGVISGRLDRLEKETKRILQEASVIGRAFLYEILDKITELKDHMDRSLGKLERLDLIRARSLEPDLEYIFKHALTQEVVYNGLLKKERQEIHERIALVMEQLFHDRLPEFFETLAIHFKQGQSTGKAVDYLMKSGEKSLGRYAVEEAHQYYKEAFDLLTMKPDKSIEDNKLLIDLLIKWGLVFYYRADFGQLSELLRAHQGLAESLNDRARLGMFYAWVGFALYTREQYDDAYQYYCKALNIGEEIENPQIIGYACTWLAWTCCELGLLDDAITFGERAQEVSRSLIQDHYLYYKSLGGIAYAYVFKGNVKKVFEAGKALSNYGKKHSSIRSIFMGHLFLGYGHFIAGDFPSAIESCEKGIKVSVDPIYSMAAKLLLGYSHAYEGHFKEAEDTVQEVAKFCKTFGCEVWETPARMLLGVTSVGKGQMSQGLRMIEETQKSFLKNKRKSFLILSESILGKLYLQIVEGAKPISLKTVAKNIGFVLKNVPSAGRKAEDHFNKTIEMGKEVGARGILGQTYLDLGFLHKEKGKKEEARTFFSESIQILEECGAKAFLKQAKEALESLG
jgi:tetratricopeptide (TPR) repeat protein